MDPSHYLSPVVISESQQEINKDKIFLDPEKKQATLYTRIHGRKVQIVKQYSTSHFNLEHARSILNRVHHDLVSLTKGKALFERKNMLICFDEFSEDESIDDETAPPAISKKRRAFSKTKNKNKKVKFVPSDLVKLIYNDWKFLKNALIQQMLHIPEEFGPCKLVRTDLDQERKLELLYDLKANEKLYPIGTQKIFRFICRS